MKRRLARFRVDPERVRVAIRPHGDLWYATIARRSDPGTVAVERMHRSPSRALALALRHADNLDLPGVDLHMQWAYEHPWPAP